MQCGACAVGKFLSLNGEMTKDDIATKVKSVFVVQQTMRRAKAPDFKGFVRTWLLKKLVFLLRGNQWLPFASMAACG